jgi:hypothetical protein
MSAQDDCPIRWRAHIDCAAVICFCSAFDGLLAQEPLSLQRARSAGAESKVRGRYSARAAGSQFSLNMPRSPLNVSSRRALAVGALPLKNSVAVARY